MKNNIIEYKTIEQTKELIDKMNTQELSLTYYVLNGDIETIKKLTREKLFKNMEENKEQKRVVILNLDNGNKAKVEMRLGQPEMVKSVETYYNQYEIVKYMLKNNVGLEYLQCDIERAKDQDWFKKMIRLNSNFVRDNVIEKKKRSNNVIKITELQNNNVNLNENEIESGDEF